MKEKEKEKQSLKVVIVGNGKVGFSLAEQLVKEKYDVTIVDMREDSLRRASDALDIMSIRGNGVSAATLADAGAAEADLLVAATNSDEVNMVCCLTAKHMGAKFTIARIRNPEYSMGLNDLKKDLGIDMIINPENATAIEISRLLRFPSAANIETFCRGRVELMGFRIQEGDFMAGKPLYDLSDQVKRLSLLFCAVDREGEVTIPNGSFVPQVGDKLYLVGRPASLDQFFRLLGRYTPKVKDVFIAGGGKVSLYLAAILEKMRMRVKIVEISEERCRHISETFPHTTVICGDGTDQELLESERMSAADAFVALTDRDEDNLIISLYAMQQGVQLPVRHAAGGAEGGGQVQPPELRGHCPGGGAGQRHLPQADHRRPDPPGGPGDAELPGQCDEHLLPHCRRLRRGHGVHRPGHHPPPEDPLEGSPPEKRDSAGGHHARPGDHHSRGLLLHPGGGFGDPHLPGLAHSGSERYL